MKQPTYGDAAGAKAPARAPRWQDAAGALGLAGLLFVMVLAGASAARSGKVGVPVGILIGLQQLAYLGGAILAIRLGRLDLTAMRVVRPPLMASALCCVGGAALTLALALTLPLQLELFRALGRDYTNAIREQEALVRGVQAESPIFAAILITCFPAICEEALFRVVTLAGFTNSMGRARGLLLTSVIFAAVHLFVPQSFNVFFIGLYLGLAVLITGSVWTGVAMHFLNNAMALFLPEPGGVHILPACAAIITAVGALAAADAWQKRAQSRL